ncbi:MAG: flagellar filament capping protein FliD, partial [Acidimicrobiales bacterium]
QATGSQALTASTAVTTGTDNVLGLTVNGTGYTLTLAAGTYTPAQLATAIDAAAGTAGAPVQASVAPTGALRISSGRQGSTAKVTVTGGDAAATLHLATGQTGTGADAVVTVGGTKTTLSSITPGQAVTLGAPGTATVTATVATAPDAAGALIASGTAHAANVSTGSGSLSKVVAAVNSSGLAATASAVQLSSGAYILQLSANRTGTDGSVTVDANAFAGSPLGTMQAIATAQDATVSVGGANGYTLSSSTDTFANLLQGTAVTASSTGQATVTVTPDAAGEATRVGKLVTAANRALADIQRYAGYTTVAKKGGPLMGSAVLTGLKSDILTTFGSVAGTSSLGDLANAGATLTKTGTIDFTRKKFTAAFAANPTEVSALFTQGGTYAPSGTANAGDVNFLAAGDGAAAGTYAVSVSRSAAQAVDTGRVAPGGAVSTGETLTVRMGTATATYTTTAGESLAAVATGLNAAFAGTGLSATAQVVSGTTGTPRLEIVSNGYGTANSFTVTSTAAGTGTTGLGGPVAGTAAAFAGTDVAGTIGGVAATGQGQILTAPTGAPLDGLAVQVSAPGIGSTTPLGTVTYRPGVAQRLVSAMTSATNTTTGSITAAIKSLTQEATGLTSKISRYQGLEQSQQSVLQQEFANMETNLGKIKNESSMLTSQLAQLPGF